MAKKISYGRKRHEIVADLGLAEYMPPVPIGNTDATVRWGVIEGGPPMPTQSMRATGSLRILKGKYNG